MSPSPSSPRRARLLGMALLAVVFAAGALAGAAGGRALDAREPSTTPAPACDAHRGRIVDQLGLSGQQRRQVDSIMARRRIQTEEFWNREGLRMRAIVDSARAEVRAVLTPPQALRYDSLRAERKAQHEAEEAAQRRADSLRAAADRQ